MRLISIIMIVAFMATCAVSAEDYVQYQNPIAKDLSGLNLTEIRAIFSGDGWFSADIGGSGYTPSINAFLKDAGEGAPGDITKKNPLRIGGM